MIDQMEEIDTILKDVAAEDKKGGNRDELCKNRPFRKIDSRRLFSRE